jgi:hypothetical protein
VLTNLRKQIREFAQYAVMVGRDLGLGGGQSQFKFGVQVASREARRVS